MTIYQRETTWHTIRLEYIILRHLWSRQELFAKLLSGKQKKEMKVTEKFPRN